MDEKKKQRYSDFIELGIVLALLLLVVSLYVPVGIWEEEESINDLAHFRMENIQSVETFYASLTDGFTENGEFAIQVVNATRDSVTADTNFTGEQVLYLDGQKISINIPTGFDVEFDTTFGVLKSRRDTIQDTILTLITYTPEIQRNDTIYVQIANLPDYESNPNFVKIVESVPTQLVELVTYYDTFYPDSSNLICPVTGKNYGIKLSDEGLRIDSPMTEPYKERRFAIFSLIINEQGYIDNGVASWSN